MVPMVDMESKGLHVAEEKRVSLVQRGEAALEGTDRPQNSGFRTCWKLEVCETCDPPKARLLASMV